MRQMFLAIGMLLLVGCATTNTAKKEADLGQVGIEPEKPLVMWVYKPQSDLTTAELSKIMVLFFRWQNMRGNVDFEKELNRSEAEEPKVSILRHFNKSTPEPKK